MTASEPNRIVLVVEDEEEIRETMVEIIRAEGYGAAGAKNGQDALDFLRAQPRPPVLILLDLRMPVMGGEEFRHEQLRDPALARVPTAIFSANAEIQAVAERLGVEDYVKKPVEIDALFSLLAKYGRDGR
jgi:CheY-like chemotaxis protein